MEKFLALLQEMPLFKGIQAEELSKLLNCLGATVRTYPKDAYILRAGDPVKLVGIVLSGEVCVMKEDFDGNRRIITTVGPKGIFAEALSFAQVADSPMTVQASTQSQVMFVDFLRISTVCTHACAFHSRLIQNMLLLLAQKNFTLNEKLDILSMRTIRQKISAYLLSQRALQGQEKIRIPYNRAELADYLGVNRSALSRELSQMQKEGLLSFRKNMFELSDALNL